MIRLAEASDLAIVQTISADAYSVYRSVMGYLPMPATEDYAPRIARGEIWLLEDTAQLVGLIVLEREKDQLLIYSIAVAPQHQGSGHAGTLLRFAEQTARILGLGQVRLYTNTRMEKNIAIYRRAGYRETVRRPHPARPAVTLIDMAKPVPTVE